MSIGSWLRPVALLTALILAGPWLTGCASFAIASDWPTGTSFAIASERPTESEVRYEDGFERDFHVPPGHRPPPGECRIWYLDRPPGHQPPPGPCHALETRVPHGAVLVYGS